MKNYSELGNVNQNPKEQIIHNLSELTGLDNGIAVRLFESQIAPCGGDFQKINENIDSMFTEFPKSPYQIAEQNLKNNFNADNTAVMDDNTFNTKVIDSITQFVEENPFDATGLVNLIANFMRVREPKTVELIRNIDFFEEIPMIQRIKIMNEQEQNGGESGTDKPLNENFAMVECSTVYMYQTLRDVLAKHSKNAKFSYHVESAYNKLWSYLNDEINTILTSQDIQTKNHDFNKRVIESIVRGRLDAGYSGLNPMYKSLDYLKANSSDLQALVFDLVALTHNWFNNHNENVLTFISTSAYKNYLDATERLIVAIWSSRENSVLVHTCDANRVLDTIRNIKSDYWQELSYQYMIESRHIGECMYIIKACTPEFNLGVRGLINSYLTSAMNLLGRVERVRIEARKNGILR